MSLALGCSAAAFFVLRTTVRRTTFVRTKHCIARKTTSALLLMAASTTAFSSATRCDDSFARLYTFEFDHYNGVTVHLDQCSGAGNSQDTGVFESALQRQLEAWKEESVRGVWMHVPANEADKIAPCIRLGFQFHMVLDDGTLVLTQWLPDDIPNRLPKGPTHQVGVGCLVWHPEDNFTGGDRRMLVVQEKTGPAAAYKLWKMPTGLADPGEDIHHASERELLEETGLNASFNGLVAFRQAHANKDANPLITNEAKTGDDKAVKASFSRKASDLFFICELQLPDDGDYDSFKACPDEIAAIRWMTGNEFCAQERWHNSPVYMELNRALFQQPTLFQHTTLPLRHGSSQVNTIYNSKL